MEKYKVSVIIPVYNVEKYIKRCIESLIKQSYTNIEIIPVDDGSPDKAGIIIDGLASSDLRIKPIHKRNGGVSSARNAGIEEAAGDYIMFVDGDDWVDPDYVSYFLSLVTAIPGTSIGVDINNYSEELVARGGKSQDSSKSFTVSAEKAIEWIYDGTLFVAVWNKIYSAALLKNIRFSNEIWYGEGMLFNIECLQNVDIVAVGTKSVYHQTFNPNSAMRKFSLESNYCGLASLWLQKAKWKKWTPEIEHKWQYHKYRFNLSIISGLVRSGQVVQNKLVYKACIRNLRKNLLLPLKYEEKRRAKIGCICYAIAPTFMAKRASRKFAENVRKLEGV